MGDGNGWPAGRPETGLHARLARARAVARQARGLAPLQDTGRQAALPHGEALRGMLTTAAHLLAMMECALGSDGVGLDDVSPAGETPRVLLADDVAMNRDIATLFLESAGYQVACAADGTAAAAMAAAADYRVVLMDVRMPHVDGLEATRRIRALGGARGSVPIIALTAQVFAEQVAVCRDAGMDTHVAKPFTLESLLEGVVRGVTCREQQGDGACAAPAPSPAVALAPPPEPAAQLPLLDMTTLNRTAALLTPEAVASYLDTLAERAEALQRGLGLQGGLIGPAEGLAEAAHALAGSAGMFGFERLVFAARHFERAVRNDPAQAAALADDLDAVLEASLEGMRTRAHQALCLQQV